jgi:hypothetical protein
MAVNVKKLEEMTNPYGKVVNNSDQASIQKLAQQRMQQPVKGTVTSVTRPSVQSVAASMSPTAASTARPSYQQEAQSLYDMMKNRATQAPREFSYDPQSDPAYQAALQRARSNIDAGNSQAQAEMNRRGILNSTITSDRMGEISSNEMGRVETDVLPSLMQQAYQRFADQQAQEQQQFQNYASLYGMNVSEDQRGFDNKVTESGLTGNYMPNGAQDIINNILQLKQQAEQKGLTAAERANLSARADGYRAQLSSMGIDPSFYASNVNSRQASQNNPALRTLQGQQVDLQRQGANWDAARSVWDATGSLVNPQSDWSGLLRQVQAGGSPLTQAAQQQLFNNNMSLRQQNFNEGQQGWENDYRNRQQTFNEGQTAWENRFNQTQQAWQNSFDETKFREDTRRFGLNYAIDLQAQNLRKNQFNYEKEMNAEAKKDMETQYKGQLADMILSQNLPDDQTEELLKKYGINEKVLQQLLSGN